MQVIAAFCGRGYLGVDCFPLNAAPGELVYRQVGSAALQYGWGRSAAHPQMRAWRVQIHFLLPTLLFGIGAGLAGLRAAARGPQRTSSESQAAE